MRVSMATWRQVISLIFPAVWSIFTQSPTEKLSSIWRTNPPRILERLSCREKTITPLTTAEVATMPERVTPKRESSHNAAPPIPPPPWRPSTPGVGQGEWHIRWRRRGWCSRASPGQSPRARVRRHEGLSSPWVNRTPPERPRAPSGRRLQRTWSPRREHAPAARDRIAKAAEVPRMTTEIRKRSSCWAVSLKVRQMSGSGFAPGQNPAKTNVFMQFHSKAVNVHRFYRELHGEPRGFIGQGIDNVTADPRRSALSCRRRSRH